MTDTAPPFDEPSTTWRGRFQRRLRRDTRNNTTHATVGLAVTTLLVVLVHSLGLLEGEALAAVEADDEAVFSAVMVGDLMFGRHVERVAEERGREWLLEGVAPLLEADYVTGNLEQVITDRPDELPRADKLIHLSSDPDTARVLADVGFTSLALANNHLMDHGIPGLRDTIAALDEVGLSYAGAGETLDDAMTIDYQEVGGLTVATLSFSDAWVVGFVARAFQGGVLDADPSRTSRLITQAAANADLVVAHFHWGTEYGFAPNRDQREIAELAALAGADIVVGHHPHVLQRVERIGDTLVFYSLGNLVFDQGWSRTRESTIARYELHEDGTAQVRFVPIEVREGAPHVVSGPLARYRAHRIFERLTGGSLPFSREDGVLVTEIDHGHVLERAAARAEDGGSS